MNINDTLLEQLKSAEEDKFKLFSLNGIITYAKILSNYDGDTADCLLVHNDTFMRHKVRFYGYDSPEMKPSLNIKDRDEIKKKALEAKKRLWKLCTDLDDINEKFHKKIIKIVCDDFDKYGRLLITAFNYDFKDNLDFDNSINKIMIDEGHGYSYFGGTKK
jgi:endonuclease YncB( thermonuclease family)